MAGVDYYHCEKCGKKILYIHSEENEQQEELYCEGCYNLLLLKIDRLKAEKTLKSTLSSADR